MSIQTHTNTRTIHTHTHTHIHTHFLSRPLSLSLTHAHTHTHTHTRTYTHTHTHTQTRARAHIHTHIHTHTQFTPISALPVQWHLVGKKNPKMIVYSHFTESITGWQTLVGLFFAGLFPQKSPIIRSSFAEIDLQLKASYASQLYSQFIFIVIFSFIFN